MPMLTDILAGVRAVADAFGKFSTLRKERADKLTRDEYLDIYLRATRLQKTAAACLRRGRSAVADTSLTSLQSFGDAYDKFFDAFSRVGYPPDWEDFEETSIFDVLNIYVPRFVNEYFKALRSSGGAFHAIQFYQELSGEEVQIIWVDDAEYGGKSPLRAKDFFLKLPTLKRQSFYTRLSEFLDAIESALRDLESSLQHLAAFIRNRYDMDDVVASVKAREEYNALRQAQD